MAWQAGVPEGSARLRNVLKLSFHCMAAGADGLWTSSSLGTAKLYDSATKLYGKARMQSIRLLLSNLRRAALSKPAYRRQDELPVRDFSRRPRPMLVSGRTSSDRSQWPLLEDQA
jgi:hypothetical protein